MATNEKTSKPMNGYVMLFLILIFFFGSIAGFIMMRNPWLLLVTFLSIFLMKGLILVNPNESRVLLLFGDYVGTVKTNGLFCLMVVLCSDKDASPIVNAGTLNH